jgi:alkyl hydroperoxide reductase subunit F
MNNKKVTLFTTNTCTYCKSLKQYLNAKNIKYNVVNLSENPERQKEIFEKSGALTVPVTLVEENDFEQVIVGLNIPKLAGALA